MRIPRAWKQSAWLRWLRPVKHWLVPPPPPPPPVLVPSFFTGAVPPPPPVPVLTLAERARLFQTITGKDLLDQISAPDISLRVIQIFDYLSQESPESPDGPAGLNHDPCALERSWDCWNALTWYAWRFRPFAFLEVGGGIGQSAALVGLNSPQTALVCFELGRDQQAGWARYCPAMVRRELTRCGFHGPVTFVSGDSHRTVAYYFSATSIRSRRRGQLRTREFDLLFVNGARQPNGIYRDLKKAFAHCALGGMVALKLPKTPSLTSSGKGKGGEVRLLGLWERIQRRFGRFRYFIAPESEVGLALRVS